MSRNVMPKPGTYWSKALEPRSLRPRWRGARRIRGRQAASGARGFEAIKVGGEIARRESLVGFGILIANASGEGVRQGLASSFGGVMGLPSSASSSRQVGGKRGRRRDVRGVAARERFQLREPILESALTRLQLREVVLNLAQDRLALGELIVARPPTPGSRASLSSFRSHR